MPKVKYNGFSSGSAFKIIGKHAFDWSVAVLVVVLLVVVEWGVGVCVGGIAATDENGRSLINQYEKLRAQSIEKNMMIKCHKNQRVYLSIYPE